MATTPVNATNISSAGLVKFDGTATFSAVTTTNHNVLIGAASNDITNVAPSSTSGVPLISQGSSSDPVFGTAVVAGGGTGLTTLTAHSLYVGNGTSAPTALGSATNGQLPIGSTGADPVLSTLTAGANITITNGAGSITIEATGGGMSAPIITSFTSNGTWTKNSATMTVLMLIWGGGGGGGSGARSTTGNGGGGGGASNGGGTYWYGPASIFASSETVTVAAGGGGGAAQTTNTTAGIDGSVGGNSAVGNIIGVGGAKGTQGKLGSTSATSSATSWRMVTQDTPQPTAAAGTNGGTGTVGAANGNPSSNTGNTTNAYFVPGAGGGGAPCDSGTARQGGNSGVINDLGSNTLVSGATGGIETGTINGGNGNPGISTGGTYTGGTGGAGGGGQKSGGSAGTGGTGGLPGGGGGGGGGSLNGTASGAGGTGGAGKVIIIEFG